MKFLYIRENFITMKRLFKFMRTLFVRKNNKPCRIGENLVIIKPRKIKNIHQYISYEYEYEDEDD